MVHAMHFLSGAPSGCPVHITCKPLTIVPKRPVRQSAGLPCVLEVSAFVTACEPLTVVPQRPVRQSAGMPCVLEVSAFVTACKPLTVVPQRPLHQSAGLPSCAGVDAFVITCLTVVPKRSVRQKRYPALCVL
eukprot:876477-Pelagomonas_calceolata.AAC.3